MAGPSCVWIHFQQTQEGPATADLNVIRVRSEEQHLAGFLRGAVETKLKHDALVPHYDDADCFQTIQGAFPFAYMSSNVCLSLNVSMDAQNPS